jgi:hypothetical protein
MRSRHGSEEIKCVVLLSGIDLQSIASHFPDAWQWGLPPAVAYFPKVGLCDLHAVCVPPHTLLNA